MKNTTSILLIVGILILVNVLSRQFFFRLDLTEDQQYTLSNATKDILRNLEEPVTITAYFSDNIHPTIEKTKDDFQNMLVEYSNRSKGMVNYEFVNPETEEEKQAAAQNGIQPFQINVRERDQAASKMAYMSAVLKMGERQELIPLVQLETGMEYDLTTSIKKLSIIDKPSVGLIQGHGEPGLSDLQQVYQSLSILYNVENIDLNTESSIADRFKTVALLAPSDTIPPAHLALLDDYLSRGGRVFIGLNTVDGNLQNAQGTTVSTGVQEWLRGKGVEVESSFVIDGNSGAVTVQQRQGFFTMQSQVQFPFLPIINTFEAHPITNGLGQILFPFASPVRYLGGTESTFTPLAFSSDLSGIVQAPTTFEVVDKKWTSADFPLQRVGIMGLLEGNIVGTTPSKMVIIGDGDFPVSGQQGGQRNDNTNLMVNCIDWLSDDTGLIELRNKGVSSRPIDEEYLAEDASSTRNLIKYGNFGLPILLIIIYGIIRMQRQRSIRMKRMQEKYS